MGTRIAGRLTLTSAERSYAADIAATRTPNECVRFVLAHFDPIVRAGLVGADRAEAIAAHARRIARARANAER